MKKVHVLTSLLSFFYMQVCIAQEEVKTDCDQNLQEETKDCCRDPREENRTDFVQSLPECEKNCLPCNSMSCLKVARIEFGAAFGDYIGIRHGYSELGLFGMVKTPMDSYVFFEGRGFLLSHHDWVTSLGLGFRMPMCSPGPFILGANIYYDHLSSRLSTEGNCDCCILNPLRRSFGSLGVGLEILSCFADFRVNAYIPVREKRTFDSHFTYPGGYFARLKTTHYIPSGVDAEISKRLNFCSCFYAVGAIGGFGYFNYKEIYGPYARLEFGWGDYLSLQARYSYDRVFHSCGQGRIIFSLPLEQLARCFDACCNFCFDPITQPVRRNYIPFTRKECCWDWNW